MTSSNNCPFRPVVQLFIVAILLLTGLIVAQAQITKSTDGVTPKGIEPGAPAGSYPITEWENVNLFNGQVSFTLPIVQKGRGESGVSLPIRINRQPWVVKHQRYDIGNSSLLDVYNAEGSWWNPALNRPVISGGSMVGRYVGSNIVDCYSDGTGYYMRSNARLTFTAPDGTEFTLIDREKGGNPRQDNCTFYESGYRGSVFITPDGSAATFYATYPIQDISYAGDPYWSYANQEFYPSGYLMLRNGTRYDIVNGAVTRVRDRNGNETNFQSLSGGTGLLITDSLKRQIVINYDVYDAPYGLCDRVTLKGFGGADRMVRIAYDFTGNWLRTTQTSDPTSPWSVSQMFPQLDNAGGNPGGPRKVAAIYLPDGRSYQFKYNVYSELARVELPTGGAIEYDYEGGEPSGTASGVIGDYLASRYPANPNWIPTIGIYRRLVERRVYKTSDISSLEGKTTYSKPVTTGSGTSATSDMLVEQWSPAGNNTFTCVGRSKHYFHGSAYQSQINSLYDSVGPQWLLEGREYRTDAMNTTSQTVLRQSEQTWSNGTFIPNNNYGYPVAINPRIIETKTTLVDTNQVAKQTFTFSNDEYNNQTDVYEYDYGTGAPGAFIRRTHTDYVTVNNGVNYATDTSIHLRNLPSQTQVFADISGTVKKAESQFEYDNYTSDGLHAPLVNRVNISGLDTGFTTAYTKRGNVTKVSQWRNTDSTYITTFSQYDIAGNVVATVDAGRSDNTRSTTTFDYADRFGAPNGEAQSNTPPSVWLSGQTTFAFPTKVTNALGHIAYTQFDYFLGRPVDTEDPNGIKSSLSYNDALDRPTQGLTAVGTAAQRQTLIRYNDSNSALPNGDPARSIITISDKDTYQESNNDVGLKATALYDGLGRIWRKATYEGSNNWAIAETQFDALGRAYRSCNPFRDTSVTASLPGSPLWTTSEYDALSRVTKVTTPDGAHVDTSYSGNAVSVTDQAGKQRRSLSDALGRLLRVDEPNGCNTCLGTITTPLQATSYSYDILDNLITVTQGVQTRTFTYDSLKRLTAATSPESGTSANGTTNYTYDNNGNLWTKTDARTAKTTLLYDALNRVTSKTYSGTTAEGISAANATPSVYYKYDNQSFPSGAPAGFNRGFALGRLVAMTYGSSTTSTGTYYGYDEIGRGVRRTQQLNGINYPLTASYNRASMMTGETYPSTRTVSYGYNAAGQLTSFSGNLGDGTPRTYVSSASYSPAGLKEREAYGMTTPLYLKLHYNKRNQMVDLRLGSVNDEWNWNRGALIFYYGTNAVNQWNPFYDDTDNNGNVRRSVNYVPTVMDGAGNPTSWVVPQLAEYDYDELNRVKFYKEHQSANSGASWTYDVAGQTYNYDRYGNRNITSVLGNVNNYNPTYDTTKNRIAGLTYDSAGNILWDGLKTMTYDAENRMVGATGGSYVYDGEGKRVKRTAAGQEWWYIYGFGGELVAEYPANGAASTPQIEYGYRGGELLIEGGCDVVRWRVTDHLGSTRMSVGTAGTLASVKRSDYLPFGEELGAGIRSTTYGYAADCWRQKFTGYERDAETGLDYAQARMYANSQGRFTSPDPLLASGRASNPQSWNRYSYTLNRPLSLIDPTGLSDEESNDSDPQSGRKKEEEQVIKLKTNENLPKIINVKTVLINPVRGELPVGGQFQVEYTYQINNPQDTTPENREKKPEDFGNIKPIKDTGTLNDATAQSGPVERVNTKVTVNPKDDSVIVTKVETFKIKERSGSYINYEVVVSDPLTGKEDKIRSTWTPGRKDDKGRRQPEGVYVNGSLPKRN